MLTQPEITSLSGDASRGRDSPVRAEVLTLEVPSSTTPSKGMRSPGFTTMMSPRATSSGSTCSSLPSRSILA